MFVVSAKAGGGTISILRKYVTYLLMIYSFTFFRLWVMHLPFISKVHALYIFYMPLFYVPPLKCAVFRR
jgi:hypothetical protein